MRRRGCGPGLVADVLDVTLPRYRDSAATVRRTWGPGIQPAVGAPRRAAVVPARPARRDRAARGVAGVRGGMGLAGQLRDRRRGWPACSGWPRVSADGARVRRGDVRSAAHPRRRCTRRSGTARNQRLPGHPADRRAQQRRLAAEPARVPDRPAARGRGAARDRRADQPPQPQAHGLGRAVRRRPRRPARRRCGRRSRTRPERTRASSRTCARDRPGHGGDREIVSTGSDAQRRRRRVSVDTRRKLYGVLADATPSRTWPRTRDGRPAADQ